MSYILEALKKAQAERQLGALPTIHAPTLDGAVPKLPLSPLKRPLVLAVGVMGVAIVALLALVWRQPAAPPAATPAATPVVAATTVPPAAVAIAAMPAVPAPPAPEQTAVPAAAKVKARTTAAPPVQVAETSVAAPAVRPVKPALPEPASAKPAKTMPPAESAAPEATPAPVKVAAVQQEDSAPPLRELPEPIQRSIPSIVMGGYMYSKNPADRLLLIDKVLRHEGEEVAPGLVLEKLQPKAAVFSFKGYRYRVPY